MLNPARPAGPTAVVARDVVASWLIDYLLAADNDDVPRAELLAAAPDLGSIRRTAPAGESQTRGARASRHIRNLLQALHRDGLISRTPDRVIILDRDGLAGWLSRQQAAR